MPSACCNPGNIEFAILMLFACMLFFIRCSPKQALEAIKLVSGVGKSLSRSLLLFDALAGRFTSVKLRRKVRCSSSLQLPTIYWRLPLHQSNLQLLQCALFSYDAMNGYQLAADVKLHSLWDRSSDNSRDSADVFLCNIYWLAIS